MEAEEANSSSSSSSSSRAPTAAAAIMEFPDWLDVVRNDDGSVKNPATEINIHVIVDLCFLAWIGSPFNLKIVFRILSDKLLRDTSRYIIQLATMIASLCVLLTNFFSIALFIFRVKGRGVEIEGFCHFYVVTAGWSYISLLFNICTSLLDSFTAVVFPMWHQRKLTPRRVVLSLLGLNAAIGLIVNHHFISGRVPLRCAIQLDHSHTQNTFGMTLYVLCVLLFGVDYLIVKKMLPSRRQRETQAARRRTAALTATAAAPPAPPAAAVVPRGPEEIEMNVIGAGGGGGIGADDTEQIFIHRPTYTNPRRRPIVSMMSVQSSASAFRKRELEATKSLLYVVAPLFLVPLPFLIYALFYQMICPLAVLINANKAMPTTIAIAPAAAAGEQPPQQQPQLQCHDFSWILSCFVPVLMSMHTIINPIMNILLNKDFSSPELPATAAAAAAAHLATFEFY